MQDYCTYVIFMVIQERVASNLFILIEFLRQLEIILFKNDGVDTSYWWHFFCWLNEEMLVAGYFIFFGCCICILSVGPSLFSCGGSDRFLLRRGSHVLFQILQIVRSLKLLYVFYCIQVLSAYVRSVEDHGFILHFGLPSFAGFMPKHNQSGNPQSILPIV